MKFSKGRSIEPNLIGLVVSPCYQMRHSEKGKHSEKEVICEAGRALIRN